MSQMIIFWCGTLFLMHHNVWKSIKKSHFQSLKKFQISIFGDFLLVKNSIFVTFSDLYPFEFPTTFRLWTPILVQKLQKSKVTFLSDFRFLKIFRCPESQSSTIESKEIRMEINKWHQKIGFLPTVLQISYIIFEKSHFSKNVLWSLQHFLSMSCSEFWVPFPDQINMLSKLPAAITHWTKRTIVV